MADSSEPERHSKAFSADLITDPEERAKREARNALRQFDTVVQLIEAWLKPDRPFKLRTSAILQLHRVALEGISAYAGNFRPADIEIQGSQHQPVGAHMVPELIEDMCDYINEHWQGKSALHLCSYVMWRLNWIHPFDDGNGRTSRALSYLILCVRLGYQLPGSNTIPDQISANKTPYYHALEAADKAWSSGLVDVSALETLLGDCLAAQLVGIHKRATGQ